MDKFISATQSPIERLMSAALVAKWLDAGGDIEFHSPLPFGELMRLASRAPYSTVGLIAPQVWIGSYRVDFLCAYRLATTGIIQALAIECDGHEFHEKTKDQAARDKKRDRDLSAMGVNTVRFTGAELWRDAGGCASCVYDMLFWQQYRHMGDAGLLPEAAGVLQ